MKLHLFGEAARYIADRAENVLTVSHYDRYAVVAVLLCYTDRHLPTTVDLGKRVNGST